MSKNFPDDTATQEAAGLPSLAELVAENPGFLDEVVLPEEASRILSMPEATLSTLRCRGGGPEFVRLGPGKRAPVGYTRRSCSPMPYSALTAQHPTVARRLNAGSHQPQ